MDGLMDGNGSISGASMTGDYRQHDRSCTYLKCSYFFWNLIATNHSILIQFSSIEWHNWKQPCENK